LKEIVIFYNVENLFSPDPNPVHKTDPTPSGLRNWNQYRYNNKIFKLGQVFQLVEEEYKQPPFIIGLAEIQNDDVLNDLLRASNLENYSYIHYESLDERGVDVALLYDSTKVKVEHSEPISFIFKIDNGNPDAFDTTRDVLFCKIRYQEQLLNVFVVHLPSKRERDINLPKRLFIINELRERVESLVMDKNEAVIVMGDFNDNPDTDLLKNLTFDKNFNKTLTNPFLDLYKNSNFSTFHYKNGLFFDQILLSAQFFTPQSTFCFKKANVFSPAAIGNWDRKFKGRPFRTYSGTRYLGGYSDHYPVVAEIQIQLKTEKH